MTTSLPNTKYRERWYVKFKWEILTLEYAISFVCGHKIWSVQKMVLFNETGATWNKARERRRASYSARLAVLAYPSLEQWSEARRFREADRLCVNKNLKNTLQRALEKKISNRLNRWRGKIILCDDIFTQITKLATTEGYFGRIFATAHCSGVSNLSNKKHSWIKCCPYRWMKSFFEGNVNINWKIRCWHKCCK